MSDEDLGTETRVIQESRRLVIMKELGKRHIVIGRESIASEEDDQVAAIARVVLQMPARMASIAWIGAGFCIGPRLIRGRMQQGALQDIYELRQRVIDKNLQWWPQQASNWLFIQGDYKTTLSGSYEVIVYDNAEEAADTALLTSHLSPGGRLLVVE